MSSIRLTPHATVLEVGDCELSVSLTREVRWPASSDHASTPERAEVLRDPGPAEHRIRATVCVQRPHGRVQHEVLWDGLAPGRALPEFVAELVRLISGVLADAGAAPSQLVPGSVAVIVARGGRPGVAGGCLVRALAWAAVATLQLEHAELQSVGPADRRWRDTVELGSGLQPRRDSRGC